MFYFYAPIQTNGGACIRMREMFLVSIVFIAPCSDVRSTRCTFDVASLSNVERAYILGYKLPQIVLEAIATILSLKKSLYRLHAVIISKIYIYR